MTIASINPATGETLKKFEALSDSQIEEKLRRPFQPSRNFAEVDVR